jgi:hypothetical protein
MLLQGAEGSVPAALIIALEHPAISSDPAILCAAADACKAWREAVQQCGACNTAVEVSLGAPLSRLCSFAHWLPQHVGLVKSINITEPCLGPDDVCAPQDVDGLPWHLHLEAAQHLLRQAMQLAAAAGAAAASGQTIVTQQQQQQQQQQRLNNISSITMGGDAAMLRALPAHSLTSMELYRLRPTPPNRPAVCAALAGLSSLRQLRLQASVSGLAGIAQLSQLTLLEVRGVYEEHHAELRQLLAQPLPLRGLQLGTHDKMPLLDLSHLTQLRRFKYATEQNATMYPPQLQQLDLSWLPAEQYSALMPLQQLQQLSFKVSDEDLTLLLHLAQLPALQQLSLEYQFATHAARAAAAWREMRPLCQLALNFGYETPSLQQWRVILSGLAAATHLTKLQLHAAVGGGGGGAAAGDEGVRGAVCAKLTGLTNLKELLVWQSYMAAPLLAPGDALALTALTGLTKLELLWLHDGVGDLAAAAVAGSCKQLCHLALRDCSLGSMACLASVRHLTQLTELCLQGGLTQQGLMLLTGLTRLQQLGVDRTAEITDEVVDSFWAALKRQL